MRQMHMGLEDTCSTCGLQARTFSSYQMMQPSFAEVTTTPSDMSLDFTLLHEGPYISCHSLPEAHRQEPECGRSVLLTRQNSLSTVLDYLLLSSEAYTWVHVM